MSDDVSLNQFEMTAEDVNEFLAEVRYATVTSLRRDGFPVSVVLGYEWDGEYLYFSIRGSRLLIRRLSNDPRVSIAVYNNIYPPKYVILQGHAEEIEDPDWERTLRMFMRYMAPDSPAMKMEGIDLEGYKKAYFEVGRTVYRVKVEKMRTEDAGKWHEAGQLGGAGSSDAFAREHGLLEPEA